MTSQGSSSSVTRIERLENQLNKLAGDVQQMGWALHGNPNSGHAKGVLSKLEDLDNSVASLDGRVETLVNEQAKERELEKAVQEERYRVLKFVGAIILFLQAVLTGGGLAALAGLFNSIP